jgi:hypothetical protein
LAYSVYFSPRILINKSKYAMQDCNLKEITTPEQKIVDPLTDLLRNGARNLIRQAVEAELAY